MGTMARKAWRRKRTKRQLLMPTRPCVRRSDCHDEIQNSYCDDLLGQCSCPLGTLYHRETSACLPFGRALKMPWALSPGPGLGFVPKGLDGGGWEVFNLPDPLAPNNSLEGFNLTSRYGLSCLTNADCDPRQDMNLRCSLITGRCVCWKYFNFDFSRQLCTFDRFCRWDNYSERCHPYHNPILYLVVVWLLAIICSIAMCWCPRKTLVGSRRSGSCARVDDDLDNVLDSIGFVPSRGRSRSSRRGRRAERLQSAIATSHQADPRRSAIPVNDLNILTPEADPPPSYEEACRMPPPPINITTNLVVDLSRDEEEEVDEDSETETENDLNQVVVETRRYHPLSATHPLDSANVLTPEVSQVPAGGGIGPESSPCPSSSRKSSIYRSATSQK